ncbi:MAG: biotin--[acetyl-CoA-carboxylase] ligase [Gammaproteobacteria bacterium]|nr:biotin--[acetyl-CoA-carboxylase] ligase [Gammaproteobacteria bacterium]NIR85383.1 biotin--[acetyl-CoA-carboxylase] ligase [Gammaproteobacteria bacterium]NIR88901.1 biotin--[acetyl-CoA-carboxylase] ligase [Gammaproteobacteria bacterium]NIU06509.1 biotin--[acetyl-CoA-carboxylase] ligase [Gammaproteobacteria bacterium]NIV53402.1 biotin--[acetyl-CoA-carboxylase] ligase [Gammaproteobacteria bacterium]
MSGAPNLPRLYELIELESVDSAFDEAVRRAKRGAEEGTLVWARVQAAGHGRLGQPWHSQRGDLHCALVLRPEYPREIALQLNYVAAVSAGVALAALVSPMISLHYRWPNDILLSGAKAAGLLLNTSAGEEPEWLVLGLAVNVGSYPRTRDYWATSVHAVEGSSEITEIQVLEGYARSFLSWINRWANEGFEPVRKAWLQRRDPSTPQVELRLASETVRGRFVDIDERGDVVVDPPEGGRRKIGLVEFYGLPPAATQ